MGIAPGKQTSETSSFHMYILLHARRGSIVKSALKPQAQAMMPILNKNLPCSTPGWLCWSTSWHLLQQMPSNQTVLAIQNISPRLPRRMSLVKHQPVLATHTAHFTPLLLSLPARASLNTMLRPQTPLTPEQRRVQSPCVSPYIL